MHGSRYCLGYLTTEMEEVIDHVAKLGMGAASWPGSIAESFCAGKIRKKCQAFCCGSVYTRFTEDAMEDPNGYKERILLVLTYIEQHLDESISLSDLSSVACFSPYHFHRIFRGMVGESVMSYIRRLKLEKAAQKLTYSDTSITGIALDTGYESHESFIRAFRARFSATPSEYRTASRRRIHEEVLKKASKGVISMEVKIKKMAKKTVACIRHVGPYSDCGSAWEKLCSWAGPKGLLGPGTEFLGICHDDPDVTPPEKIRYDACITVGDGIAGEGDISIQEIGGRDFAVAVHNGSYNNLINTYAYICGQWLPKARREIASAPSVEIYLNNPEDTPEDKLVTEVYVPLEDL